MASVIYDSYLVRFGIAESGVVWRGNVTTGKVRQGKIIMKVEELIDITDKIDAILHEYGYSVNHDILSHHILRTIKDSYPNNEIQLESPGLVSILGTSSLKPLSEIV